MACKKKKKTCGSSARYDHDDMGYEPAVRRGTGLVFASEDRRRCKERAESLHEDAANMREAYRRGVEERKGWIHKAMKSSRRNCGCHN